MSDEMKDTGTARGNGPAQGNRQQGTPDVLREAFAGLFSLSRDGIAISDVAGSLVAWNPAMERFTGLAAAEVAGKNLDTVLTGLLPEKEPAPERDEHRPWGMSSMAGCGAAAGPAGIVHEIRCPDNSVRVLESCTVAVPVHGTFFSVAIFRDVTGLRKSADTAWELNRNLNKMSSVSRHDINNQLTILSGYLTLLETGTPSVKTEEIIGILQKASSKIQRILKFTREYQEIRAKPAEWQSIEDALRIARTMTEPGPVRIIWGDPCSRTAVLADPTLARVFSNLIENSLRHGEKVTEIRVGCRQEEHRLVIAYEDDGVGIPAKARAVLFERGKGRDTGYGLFLAREILAVTGLSIAETGTAGPGARFEITVPEGSFRPADS